MIALCKTNEAFEDILTSGKSYSVIELRNGSVLLADDRGNKRWFGLSRFALKRVEEAVTC
ncbi:hypothetical protein [Motiliproteus sediminis]|uniref:hypothetical protein n=1 Tax=Motiliproteus sediminis TaxID=1468178 RepID=UPI001AEFFE61|nr:hypothetical protein [Motiliproteus sediminis]